MAERIKTNLSIITPSGAEIPTIIDVKGAGKFIRYGEDNQFPQMLWDSYLKCSNLQAIINSINDYIIGDGLIIANDIAENEDGDTLAEVVKKCVFDYLVFGSFAVEVIRSRGGEIAQVIYQNIMNVRLDEDKKTAYLSNKWGQWRSEVIELPCYNSKEQQNHFIYYFNGVISRGVYGIPMYIGALKSVQILNNTRNFHLRNLENNFSANAIINFNNGRPADDVQEEIEKRFKEKFGGTENAGKFVLVFNDSKEQATTIERLDADKFGELYQALQESSVNDLFVAFRIAPILVGVNPQNNGFSKVEYLEAFSLYNRTVVKPLQDQISKAFRKIGILVGFRPFQIEDINAQNKEEQQ